jgi:hypothetical protein
MKMLMLTSGLIASVLVLSFTLKVPQVHAQTSCDYYASSNGTGTGISPSTPFQISKFWSVAKPGKTLCLLDGTYSRLVVPPTFVGTAAQPITIRAVNDGQVTFNGGGNRAGDLEGSYGILEGVNLYNGGDSTLMIRGDHWIVRRVVAWDAGLTAEILALAGEYNVLEDCAAFGTGRYTLNAGANHQGPSYNIMRRCWASSRASQGETFPLMMGYGQSNVTFENMIANWNNGSSVPTNPAFDSWRTQNSRIMGLISYATATDVNVPGLFRLNLNGGSDPHPAQDTLNMRMRHILAFYHPNNPHWGNAGITLNLDSRSYIEDSIGVAAYNSLGSITASNVRFGTSISAALAGSGFSNVWDALPGICKRYASAPGDSSSTLTTQGLWPWPMNQRIKDALVQSGRTPVDVTQTMEGMFGPIPQACKTGTPNTGALPEPRNVRVIGAN